MENPEISAAWITATIAIIGMFLTIISQAFFQWLDTRNQRKIELMANRRLALLKGLKVLDHFYSNLPMDGKQNAIHPHPWNLSDAHDAMNGMIVFCKNPKIAVESFTDALGLRDEGDFSPMRRLHDFRCIVCDELSLPRTNYNDGEATWIGDLAGATCLGEQKLTT